MIYFLRHVKTINNQLNIISGQSETEIIPVPRSSTKFPIQELDNVFSSPSKRCVYTLVNNNITLKNVKYDKRLVERDMGDFEGKSKAELIKSFPDSFFESNGKIYFDVLQTPLSGESFEEFYDRVNSFFVQHIKKNGNNNILICSHNQTLKLLYFIIAQIKIDNYKWTKINYSNNSIIAVNEMYSSF